jgi:hypothetical protein
MDRPSAWHWLRYTFGGRLPDRYRDWVLYDATCRTWLLRYAVRVVVQALPWLIVGFTVLAVFTPVPVELMLAAIGLALVTSLYFTLTSADELAEARLVKHGFEPGTGKTVRRERRFS